ncbi:E3 ubiquitin-protein ligase TRIM71-like [Oopsacas minuta]|uniref:E3 ubiquitin-protein ligase TRIM71-like n=1 Tax=Oopsacas minuta TaxID=111878 RepID=A0AAV7JMR4_9METZ|nr:E3 ubiquitin-protein ligase TRIM71-like [Oopsacas minuta]
MASVEVKRKFIEQVKESRSKIRDCFKKSHEALQLRESILLSRIDEIEKEYNIKNEEMQELLEALNKSKSLITDTLTSNKLKATHRGIESLINNQIEELSADTDSSILFEWNNQFEADIGQLGAITLNGQTDNPHSRTFPPQVKPVVPDYKAKQLPTAYWCKKSTDKKAPGELNCPSGIAIHYQTGNIYIADCGNHRIQVFSSNGDYLFMFSEKMNLPVGICISQNNVFVTQWSYHCINTYELEGKFIKSVGSQGNGEVQFNFPRGLDVSDRDSNVYVCDCHNDRVQILTQELNFHSMLGIDLFVYPRDVKVTRDRVLVLDASDLCMFVFNSEHVLTNRLITRGGGKQTINPLCFDIDRDYNIIMSDYDSHCLYVFNQEGEQIHKFGKEGQGIGEFYRPWGIALDNTGHIVVCQKNNCLQFF